MKKLILFAFFIFVVNGCTHLQSVSTTSIPKERGEKVSATKDRFIFLAFNFNNDYVNDLAEELANKCEKGKVQGVLTKHENIMYFPLIAHAVRVTAEGYCVR
jgi:hypothetical protein